MWAEGCPAGWAHEKDCLGCPLSPRQTSAALKGLHAGPTQFKPCSLAKPVQELIDLIFDSDMFKAQMSSFELDTEKMPLGKLSKAQIGRG